MQAFWWRLQVMSEAFTLPLRDLHFRGSTETNQWSEPFKSHKSQVLTYLERLKATWTQTGVMRTSFFCVCDEWRTNVASEWPTSIVADARTHGSRPQTQDAIVYIVSVVEFRAWSQLAHLWEVCTWRIIISNFATLKPSCGKANVTRKEVWTRKKEPVACVVAKWGVESPFDSYCA